MKIKITKVGNFYLKEDEYDIWYSKFKSKNYFHRLDGPSFISKESCLTARCKTCKINPVKCVRNMEFWIDDDEIPIKDFAKETNHLMCKKCKYFCNQKCFF